VQNLFLAIVVQKLSKSVKIIIAETTRQSRPNKYSITCATKQSQHQQDIKDTDATNSCHRNVQVTTIL